jgi:hypothetical protein
MARDLSLGFFDRIAAARAGGRPHVSVALPGPRGRGVRPDGRTLKGGAGGPRSLAARPGPEEWAARGCPSCAEAALPESRLARDFSASPPRGRADGPEAPGALATEPQLFDRRSAPRAPAGLPGREVPAGRTSQTTSPAREAGFQEENHR